MSYRERNEDQFKCWFEKKQQLNENIARVCSKYGVKTAIIQRQNSLNNFLHHGKMVNCIIAKVQMASSSFSHDIRLFKVASTTWIAEFLKLDSKTTKYEDDARNIIKKGLAIKKRKYQKILSDPSSNMVIFSTVRHPFERYLLLVIFL